MNRAKVPHGDDKAAGRLRVLVVADGQSPHSRNWIRHLVARGHEVFLVTTYPCETESLGLIGSEVLTVDFSAKVRAGEKGAAMGTGNPAAKKSLIGRLRGGRLWKALSKIRNASAPRLAVRRAPLLRAIVDRVKPDLVHALRIPFEGILASQALKGSPTPLVISTWGNDFTLFAAESPTVAGLTRVAMGRVDGVHSDCAKDLRIAREEYGFSADRPGVVLPGNGGIETNIFHLGPKSPSVAASFGLDPERPIVLNPRGLKPYIRTEEFFAALPLVLERVPNAQFACLSAQGKALAESAIESRGIGESVRLLPSVSHAEMAELFRLSDVVVSPSDHDGTPNTLLEAMACGAFPVAGDIESTREWIEDGENGLLVDQRSPESIAEGIVRALLDPPLRERARGLNQEIIAERAALESVFPRAEAFYAEVVKGK